MNPMKESAKNSVRIRMVFQYAGLIPLIGPIAILFYYAKAAYYLGYFPRPGLPDPKDLPFEKAYSITNTLADATFSLELLILGIMLMLVIRSLLSSAIDKILLLALFMGRVLFWFFCLTPIFEWFVD